MKRFWEGMNAMSGRKRKNDCEKILSMMMI